MLLRPQELRIDPSNPFANDKLERKPSVESVSEIIISSEQPTVISIAAPWGFGKTTFLRMLAANLDNSGIKSVHFNAWESDYIEDPLVAILGDFETQLKTIARSNSQLASNLRKAKSLGGKIIRASIPVAAKIATAGILDLSDFNEDALSDFAEKVAKQQIKDYEVAKKSIGEFKKSISDSAKSAYASNDETNPLVIFIDELDRCKPTHAIRILEIVKHLFSIERVVFVVALDPEQLAHSIRSQYGAGMDVDGYLKRFFDVELNLPSPPSENFISYQFELFGLNSFFESRINLQVGRHDKSNLLDMFKSLTSSLELSPRELQRAFASLSMAIRSTPGNQYLHPVMLSALIILKIKNQTLYRSFVNRNSDFNSVIAYLSSTTQGRSFMSSHAGAVLRLSWYKLNLITMATEKICQVTNSYLTIKMRLKKSVPDLGGYCKL